ncbi:MAG: nitroreductase family protein [Rhodospirillales bacterium]
MTTTRRNLILCAALAAIARLAPAQDEAAGIKSFLEVFPQRQTVRRYKPDPVPEQALRQILDAARYGPTCMNQQPWKFLVVRDRAKIEAMKKQTLGLIEKQFESFAAENKDLKPEELNARKERSIRFTEGYFTAPVYVVVLVDAESACSEYALRHDGPIAAAYLMLAARAFGYGTAYLTDGIPDSVTRDVLAIPARYRRICITPIGVPDGWPKKQEKRKLEEIVAWETLEGHPPLKRLPYNP